MTDPNWDDEPPPSIRDDWDPEDVPAVGAELLGEVRSFLCKFVAFPSGEAAVAVTLWAAHAHLFAAFDSTPRLALLSPEPGSGKSRTLEVLELLCPAPLMALSASPAAIFRTIEAAPPTLLLDEVDAIFGRYGKDDSAEDLRALLNAGHRNGATIPRCVGPKHEVQKFPVFTPVALAGLGDLPDTLMTRSVVIRMRRRRTDETVVPFRHRDATPDGHRLRDALADWCESVAGWVGNARPDLPVEDRPADVWEPLVAIADAAGGHWPSSARAACSSLAGEGASREASLGIRLLSDLRDVFDNADHLATTTILEGLNGMDEAPWADLRGKALDARGLARRLRQYGIGSTKVRIGESTFKGYRREDLWDAWQRYCPTPTPGDGERREQGEQPRSDRADFVPPVPFDGEHDPGRGTQSTPGDLPGSSCSPCSPYAEGEADPFDAIEYETEYPEMFG